MKRWVLGAYFALLVICVAVTSLLILHRPNAPTPNFQVTDVNISKTTIRDWSNMIFYGYVLNSCSFLYTASQPVTCMLEFSNDGFNLAPKTVTLTYYLIDDTEKVDTFEISPYASDSRSFGLLPSQTLSGLIDVSGSTLNDLHVYFNYHNYTQTVDFSFNVINAGFSDGFAVVELQSDGLSIWSNRYTLAAGGIVRESGSAKIPDKEDHMFQLVVSQQG